MIANNTRALDIRPLRREPSQHAIFTKVLGKFHFITQAILKADCDSVAFSREKMPHALCRSRIEIRLALNEYNISGLDRGRIRRRSDRDMAISAVADHLQAVLVDRINVLPPRIDKCDIETTFRHQTTKQTAHCTSTENYNMVSH
jgi:hypothetical protein